MEGKKIYITYIKENPEIGEIYSGMAGGIENPIKVLSKRESSHHKNKFGFGNALIDKVSENYDAIRGREQMLIEFNGGAKSENGTSGNDINSISKRNKKRIQYLKAAIKLFGFISLLFLTSQIIRAW